MSRQTVLQPTSSDCISCLLDQRLFGEKRLQAVKIGGLLEQRMQVLALTKVGLAFKVSHVQDGRNVPKHSQSIKTTFFCDSTFEFLSQDLKYESCRPPGTASCVLVSVVSRGKQRGMGWVELQDSP